ncbi:hypothetical protein PMAYCL1PPCAC_10470, partial [Pristionchus mayeri]
FSRHVCPSSIFVLSCGILRRRVAHVREFVRHGGRDRTGARCLVLLPAGQPVVNIPDACNVLLPGDLGVV